MMGQHVKTKFFFYLMNCVNSMYPSVLLVALDPSLGRADFNSCSDQTLMEILFEGLSKQSKRKYQDKDGMFIDVCKWPCVICDADERVIDIYEFDEMSGSLQLSYLPPHLEDFSCSQKGITGSADLSHLPQGLLRIDLEFNDMTGTVDLAHLPQNMDMLSLNNNRFEGTIDLTRLPESMEVLDLKLNAFTGSVDLTALPESMELLSLEGNQFSESFIATNLPPALEEIDASQNRFSPNAVVESHKKAKFTLQNSGVISAVDENGKKTAQRVFF